jgi:hypothetical protein
VEARLTSTTRPPPGSDHEAVAAELRRKVYTIRYLYVLLLLYNVHYNITTLL